MCPPEERDQLILSPYHPLQLPLPDCFPPRYGHSITAVELAPGLIEVTVFGGISQLDASNSKSLDHQTMVAETIIMSFGMLGIRNCCLCSVVYEWIWVRVRVLF